MKIQSTNLLKNAKPSVLIVGESGAGKTSSAKTLDEPTLIISSESGLLCLADQNMDYIDITQDDDGKPLPKDKRIKKLLEVLKYLQTPESKEKYKCIFIDSLTEISENMIEALNAEFPDRKDSLVMFSENNKRMRILIKAFRDLTDYTVIFTALPSVEKDENNKRFIGPNLVGKLSQTVCGYFDEVFYLNSVLDQEGNNKRYFITSKSDGLMCKDRSGKLEKIEEVNLGKIIKKIRG